MANRQHGRGRSQTGSRTARTVPVSRSPAAGRSQTGSWSAGESWTPPQPGTPGYVEPEVRRWPHPLEDPPAGPAPEPALHYIRCALSYQNQLLADMKALLEQLALDRTAGASPAEPDASGGGPAKL